jgi:cytochrome c biogenesis protein CcmG/thiol:disulfide interchange protein DsbE
VKRPFARAAAVVVLVCGAALGCRVEDGSGGGPAPAFKLQDLAGREVSLEDLRGKPVVVDFWATWCEPCEFQIPILNEVYEKYRDRVEIVGVAVDVDGREVVEPFAKKREIAYRVLLGDEDLALRYGARGFPSLYVIGRDGNITLSHVGLIDADELTDALDAALAADPKPPPG